MKKSNSLLPEIFLAPTAAQLEQLTSDHERDDLLRADILREMGTWGTMLVLRPTTRKREKKTFRKPIHPGRWGAGN